MDHGEHPHHEASVDKAQEPQAGEHSAHSEHSEHAAHHMDEHAVQDEHMLHGQHSAAGEQHMAHDEHAQHAAHDGNAEHAGHAAHADHTGHEQMFRRRFWGSLLLSIPVLALGSALPELLGLGKLAFPGSMWVVFVFAMIVFAYGGVPFLRMAVPEIRNREPGMMTLISLAISVALVYSVAAQLFGLGEGFFWELVTLIDIMLLGHWLEMRSVRQASGALNELARLMPDTAERLGKDGGTETVPVSALKLDDMVLVRPGASIPADAE